MSGYPGGIELNIAMERGEIDGRCGWSWSAIKATNLSWINEKKIRLLVQMGLSKESGELPDVPWIMDRATNDRDRQMLDLLLARQVSCLAFHGAARACQKIGRRRCARHSMTRCAIPGSSTRPGAVD